MPLRPTTRDDKLTLLFYLLTRQTGAIADCIRHIQGEKKNAECTDEEYSGWIAYMKTELGDATMIIRKMCDVLEIDYDGTVILGIRRDTEKRQEYLERHPGAHWV